MTYTEKLKLLRRRVMLYSHEMGGEIDNEDVDDMYRECLEQIDMSERDFLEDMLKELMAEYVEFKNK